MFEALADWVTITLLSLNPETSLGGAVRFFIYDLSKIGVLLVVMVYLMGLFKAWMPMEKIRGLMVSERFQGGKHAMAAVFGALTPFCSCSSIPIFIGFLQAGIPLGVTFSFLIASPLVNEVAVALMFGLFGWKITVAYALAGILLGTVLGWGLGHAGLENQVEDWVQDMRQKAKEKTSETVQDGRNLWTKVHEEATTIIRQVALYIVVGLALAAGIHGFVPTEMIQQQLQAAGPLAVPAAVILSIPLYAGAAGVVPVLEALVIKGVPIGTALAFMMGTVGLSLPEGMLLKKVLKPKLLGLFFGGVGVAIIGVGFLFNLVL